jgi:hypothetical protein
VLLIKLDKTVINETVKVAKEFLYAELAKYDTWKEYWAVINNGPGSSLKIQSELNRIIKFNNAQTFESAKGNKGVGQTTILKFLGKGWKQWGYSLD